MKVNSLPRDQTEAFGVHAIIIIGSLQRVIADLRAGCYTDIGPFHQSETSYAEELKLKNILRDISPAK